jgi:hypothetical protein
VSIRKSEQSHSLVNVRAADTSVYITGIELDADFNIIMWQGYGLTLLYEWAVISYDGNENN